MIINQNIIEFRGMPLFQRACMKANSGLMANMQNMACFFYVVDGTYEAIESHGAYKVGKKEALLKKCGNYIAHYFGNKKNEHCEAVAVYFYPDLLHELYKDEVPSFSTKNSVPPKKMIANELIDKYMNNLFIYFENPNLIDEELALLKLKELIMLLLRSDQYESVQKFLSDMFSPVKLKFTSIIENNLFSNLSMQELAFICNKSLSSFKRDFKEVYGDSPARYIKSRRLEKAANLLLSSEDSVSGIAYDCGFVDATTFSASFHTKFNVSPSQYRLAQTRKN